MMDPQLLAQLALKNPQLLATMLASKGAAPPAPGQMSGLSPTQMVNPGAPPAPALPPVVPQPPAATPATAPATATPEAASTEPALGDILAGVQASQAQRPPNAAAIAPMGQTMAAPNILQLMQMLAAGRGGQGGMMPGALGRILGG